MKPDWPKTCAAVIPCFNEASAIAVVVAGVKVHVPTVIIVDDGSTDRTGEAARAAGAEVLVHARNLGKGAALRTGLKRARSRGFTWAMCMDGDGQHSAEDIPAFFECAEQTSAALVIGDRLHNAAAMPFMRRLVNRWMSRRLSTAAAQALPDSQCGFRLINLAAWSALDLRTDRFEIESEMTLAFARDGQKIAFVPVKTIYKSERSKIHPVKDTVRWLRWFRATRGR